MSERRFAQQLKLYKDYDEYRHRELEQFAVEHEHLQTKVVELTADLASEQQSRRYHQSQAEGSAREAEDLRSQINKKGAFAVVLIDGDGYLFKRDYYGNAKLGGSEAAHALYNNVQEYLHIENSLNGMEIEVTVFVLLNKHYRAKNMNDHGIIDNFSQLDEFLWSFTTSRSMFQAVDCGPGKERVDAKLRDLYKFYLSSVQCKHIFFAGCHDNGYETELSKYRHDPAALAKTVLVQHGNTGKQYVGIPFTWTEFDAFDMQPLATKQQIYKPPSQVTTASIISGATRIADDSRSIGDHDNKTENSKPAAEKLNMWSTVASRNKTTAPRSTTSATSGDAKSSEVRANSKDTPGDPINGIPVNAQDERVDKPIKTPTTREIERFKRFTEGINLCNNYHLGSGCWNHKCFYSHEEIDKDMLYTLSYFARSLACPDGTGCRNATCYQGHRCPWVPKCLNKQCKFRQNGTHDVEDTKIVAYVAAE